jgi:hypothetical protein
MNSTVNTEGGGLPCADPPFETQTEVFKGGE